MSVGLLIYGSLETISGGYLYDRKLVEYLRKQGHKVEIFSLLWRNYGAHLTDNWSAKLHSDLCSAKLDLLLQDELNHPSLAWLNSSLRREVHYPIISIVHHLRSSEAHPAWLLPLYRRVERRYLQTVDGFVYNSQTTRQSVESLLTIAKPSMVVYPGATHLQIPERDKNFQSALERKSLQPLQILFVGNIIERKGLHALLAGLSAIRDKAWHLEIIGSEEVDRAYAQRIRQQIVQSGLSERVTFHGRVDDEKLMEQLRRAHLLAVPSYEGFGIVYLEAMAYGVPVLASKAGAAHEIVEPGVNGFLVSPESPLEIARSIVELVEARERWLQMAVAARRRFEAHPAWDEGFAGLEHWLSETILG